MKLFVKLLVVGKNIQVGVNMVSVRNSDANLLGLRYLTSNLY